MTTRSPVASMVMEFVGAVQGTEAGRLVAPLRAFFGSSLADFSDIMPYRTIQSLYDAIFPKGRDGIATVTISGSTVGGGGD